MAELTDDQVRAELERMNDGVLSLLFVKYRRYQTEHHLIGEDDDNLVVALRLLAESQQALGEIEQKTRKLITHPPIPGHTLPIMLANALVVVNKIARNAVKGRK